MVRVWLYVRCGVGTGGEVILLQNRQNRPQHRTFL